MIAKNFYARVKVVLCKCRLRFLLHLDIAKIHSDIAQNPRIWRGMGVGMFTVYHKRCRRVKLHMLCKGHIGKIQILYHKNTVK